MAYVNSFITLMPDYLLKGSTVATPLGLSKVTFTATTHYISTIFMAPKTGNIQYIGVPIAGVAATPPDLTASIEGATSTRVPNGVSAGYARFTATSGYSWINIGSIAVAAGTNYSAVIRDQSIHDGGGTSVDASHDVTIGWKYSPKNSDSDGLLSPFSTYYNGSSSTSNSDIPVIALRYDDGSFILGHLPIINADVAFATSFNSGSSPAQRGNSFTVPFKCKCGGAYICLSAVNANSNFSVRLRDSSNNQIRFVTYTANTNYSNADGKILVQWPEVELEPNKVYRIILNPSSANGLYDRKLTFSASSDRILATNGADIYRTTGDGSTWTDTATELSLITPIITEIYANGRRGIE